MQEVFGPYLRTVLTDWPEIWKAGVSRQILASYQSSVPLLAKKRRQLKSDLHFADSETPYQQRQNSGACQPAALSISQQRALCMCFVMYKF